MSLPRSVYCELILVFDVAVTELPYRPAACFFSFSMRHLCHFQPCTVLASKPGSLRTLVRNVERQKSCVCWLIVFPQSLALENRREYRRQDCCDGLTIIRLWVWTSGLECLERFLNLGILIWIACLTDADRVR